MIPEMVKTLEELPIELLLAKLIFPLAVALPLLLINAPVFAMPLPERFSALVML